MRYLPIVFPEIAQIGRRLVLLGGHQEAIAAAETVLAADADMVVTFAANLVAVPDRLVGDDALVDLDLPSLLGAATSFLLLRRCYATT